MMRIVDGVSDHTTAALYIAGPMLDQSVNPRLISGSSAVYPMRFANTYQSVRVDSTDHDCVSVVPIRSGPEMIRSVINA